MIWIVVGAIGIAWDVVNLVSAVVGVNYPLVILWSFLTGFMSIATYNMWCAVRDNE